MADYLRVKNWENLQHYKDRSPPWIKLHRELLRDYEFSCLQDASKLHLMLIWLLASQLDNKIPHDSNWIQRQIGTEAAPDLKPLIDSGFLILEQDASKPLATCKQSAMPETETETDKSMSDSDESNAPASISEVRNAKFDEWWEAYANKTGRKKTETAWRNLKWAKMGIEPDDLIADTLHRHQHDPKWPQYQPNPLTYLNGERWNDELPVVLPKDRDELWRIRAAIGLDYQYDDLKACHAEITQRLRAQPELREVAGL